MEEDDEGQQQQQFEEGAHTLDLSQSTKQRKNHPASSSPQQQTQKQQTPTSQPLTEWQDLLNNGAVMKRVVRASPAESPVTPEYKQQVVLHLVGRTQSEPSRVFQNTREGSAPIRVIVGDQTLDFVPPGVMLAARLMPVGEISIVKLAARYGFGQGAPWLGLEPDQDVEYEVELLGVGDFSKEPPEMTQDELIETVVLYKNRGNEFFKFELFDKALRCYKEGVRYGDALHQLPENETVRAEGERERVACLNNIATVLERQGKLKEAMESTVLVLQADPRHLKALVRAARVAVLQGSHEEAIAAVEVAMELAPTNEAVLATKKDLDARIEKHKQLEKQRWGGFLKPVSGEVAEALRRKEAEEQEARRKHELEQRELDAAHELEQQQQPLLPVPTAPATPKPSLSLSPSHVQSSSLTRPEMVELLVRLFFLLTPLLATLTGLLAFWVLAA